MNKHELLCQLQSNKTKYKRLSLSPIRYGGGKSLAVGHVVEQLPDNITRLVSPFFGGGSIEIAINQKLDIPIIASDINETLINYWRHQIHAPHALYQELRNIPPTKEEYQRIKTIIKEWRAGERRLTPLEQATYFFYNHNLSYGPSFPGWASSIYLNEKKYTSMIEKVRDFRATIDITCESFEHLFARYPHDFFYCDPPYFLKTDDETSKMFNGIYPERNHPIYHNSFDHTLLRDLLYQHRGGFILSYNDCATSREYYKQYKIIEPTWQYTMGQGETRISHTLNNRDTSQEKAHIKQSHELLAIK